MTAPTINTKSDLLTRIDKAWSALDALLAALTETQMTSLQDQNGWSVKDHLTHVAVWEDSVSALFEGKPRHQGLGIDESAYSTASIDEMNALIRERQGDKPLSSAMEHLRSSHRTLMSSVRGLSDADLKRQARELFPTVPQSDRKRLIDIIYENTAEHFDEHRGWIEGLVAS